MQKNLFQSIAIFAMCTISCAYAAPGSTSKLAEDPEGTTKFLEYPMKMTVDGQEVEVYREYFVSAPAGDVWKNEKRQVANVVIRTNYGNRVTQFNTAWAMPNGQCDDFKGTIQRINVQTREPTEKPQEWRFRRKGNLENLTIGQAEPVLVANEICLQNDSKWAEKERRAFVARIEKDIEIRKAERKRIEAQPGYKEWLKEIEKNPKDMNRY